MNKTLATTPARTAHKRPAARHAFLGASCLLAAAVGSGCAAETSERNPSDDAPLSQIDMTPEDRASIEQITERTQQAFMAAADSIEYGEPLSISNDSSAMAPAVTLIDDDSDEGIDEADDAGPSNSWVIGMDGDLPIVAALNPTILANEGGNRASEPADDPDDLSFENDPALELEQKGWSNRQDARFPLPLSTVSRFHADYRHIGQFSTGCTGTIIRGNRNNAWVLTAAHCLFDGAGNLTINNQVFWPRRDSNQAPWGAWVTASSSGWLIYSEYLSLTCHDNGTTSTKKCAAVDIAAVQIFPVNGAGWPGTMAAGSQSTASIDRVGVTNVGYPACNAGGAPNNCVWNRAYKDGFTSGDTGKWGQKRNGEHRTFKFQADISPGHSGGPMYGSFNGVNRVVGVAVAESCSGRNCSGNLPNTGRRITPDWVQLVNGLPI